MIQCRPRPPLVEVTVTTQSILTSGHDGCSLTSFVRVNFKSLQPRFQMCMAWYERTVSARAHRQRELSVRKLDAAFAQQLLVETFHIVVFSSVSRGTDRHTRLSSSWTRVQEREERPSLAKPRGGSSVFDLSATRVISERDRSAPGSPLLHSNASWWIYQSGGSKLWNIKTWFSRPSWFFFFSVQISKKSLLLPQTLQELL